jgi:hypothetical protein
LEVRAAGRTFKPDARRSPSFTAANTAGSKSMWNNPAPSWATRLPPPPTNCAVWGPFVAEGGTFELSGSDVLTMRATVAKTRAAMRDGASSVYTYRREGERLILTEVRTPAGPRYSRSRSRSHASSDRHRRSRDHHDCGTPCVSARRSGASDDEILHGAMFTNLSERGIRVTLACATNGEAGKSHASVGVGGRPRRRSVSPSAARRITAALTHAPRRARLRGLVIE